MHLELLDDDLSVYGAPDVEVMVVRADHQDTPQEPNGQDPAAGPRTLLPLGEEDGVALYRLTDEDPQIEQTVQKMYSALEQQWQERSYDPVPAALTLTAPESPVTRSPDTDATDPNLPRLYVYLQDGCICQIIASTPDIQVIATDLDDDAGTSPYHQVFTLPSGEIARFRATGQPDFIDAPGVNEAFRLGLARIEAERLEELNAFNPATDLPVTQTQLEQVKAVAVAEYHWSTFGGPIIEQIRNKETSTEEAAGQFADEYGVNAGFWQRHLNTIVRQSGP